MSQSRSMHQSRFLPPLAMMCLFGCQPTGTQNQRITNPPAKYNYEEPTAHRPLVTSAIYLANQGLALRTPLRLHASWKSDAPKEAIRVYVVSGKSLGDTEYCWVPPGESYVFINSNRLPSLVRLLGHDYDASLDIPDEGFSPAKPDKPNNGARSIVALVLLHEIGHIKNGDAGDYITAEKVTFDDIAEVAGTAKLKELEADRFCVDIIKDAQEKYNKAISNPIAYIKGEKSEAWAAAINPQLTDSQRAEARTGFLKAARESGRQLKFIVDLKDVIFTTTMRITSPEHRKQWKPQRTTSYSHLNLELRFLIMYYLLNPTEGTAMIVKDYLDGKYID